MKGRDERGQALAFPLRAHERRTVRLVLVWQSRAAGYAQHQCVRQALQWLPRGPCVLRTIREGEERLCSTLTVPIAKSTPTHTCQMVSGKRDGAIITARTFHAVNGRAHLRSLRRASRGRL